MKPIMLMMRYSVPRVVAQESRATPTWAPAGATLVSLTQRGLVDFGRADVVAQRERSASVALSLRWKATAVFLSGERNHTEIGDPGCQTRGFPKIKSKEKKRKNLH